MLKHLIYCCLILSQAVSSQSIKAVEFLVLGTVQDGGAPHIECYKSCCVALSDEEKSLRKVTSLALKIGESYYLFEATPDISSQMRMMHNRGAQTLKGVFLTHAHLGHYAGLMYLGKEAWGTQNLEVFALPRMRAFLEQNGPWSQLVTQQNIAITSLAADTPVVLQDQVKVTPILVPHRDEFSETVGYRIEGPTQKVLFLPDIDKWQRWSRNLIEELDQVDYAFVDATFYDAEEINYRPIAQIPHPFVVETMALLKNLPIEQKQKLHFIHMNHTNPLLNPQSEATKKVLRTGFRIARIGNSIQL